MYRGFLKDDVGFSDDMLSNLAQYKKYGQLFDKLDSNLNPIDFINFTVTNIKKIGELKRKPYIMETQPGNPYTLYFHCVYGDSRRALYETMQRILSNSMPNPTSATERSYTRAVVDHKTLWIHKVVEEQHIPELYAKWLTVHKMLTSGRNNGSLVVDTDLTLPGSAVAPVMDKSMAPEEIRTRCQNLVQIQGDLPSALLVYTNLVYLEIEKEKVSKELSSIKNRFDYLSDIAKTNTLIWMNTLL
jgi:hypothetical protein